MAAKATGLPIEFFKLMPRGAFRRVAGMVRRYMNADDETKNHVMQLGKPHSYKGKEYREIDLNGVADLNTLNESEAEKPDGPRGLCGDGERHQLSVRLRDRLDGDRHPRRISSPRCRCMSC